MGAEGINKNPSEPGLNPDLMALFADDESGSPKTEDQQSSEATPAPESGGAVTMTPASEGDYERLFRGSREEGVQAEGNSEPSDAERKAEKLEKVVGGVLAYMQENDVPWNQLHPKIGGIIIPYLKRRGDLTGPDMLLDGGESLVNKAIDAIGRRQGRDEGTAYAA